jgi:hypothetical protein
VAAFWGGSKRKIGFFREGEERGKMLLYLLGQAGFAGRLIDRITLLTLTGRKKSLRLMVTRLYPSALVSFPLPSISPDRDTPPFLDVPG